MTINTAVLAHIGWGGFLTLLAALFVPIFPAAVIAAIIAVGKESIESLWGVWEPVQPWKDGAIDVGSFSSELLRQPRSFSSRTDAGRGGGVLVAQASVAAEKGIFAVIPSEARDLLPDKARGKSRFLGQTRPSE